MQIERQNFSRIGTMTSLFESACERGYDQFVELSRQIKERGNPEYDPELDEMRLSRDIAGVQTIVFSGMCFESAIYEYAADHLGDAYVRDHLDKLDVLSKWIVVMRLVMDYEFRKDQAPYSSLRDLISARNKLVHSKSEPLDFGNLQEQINRLMKAEEKYYLSVHNAYRAIVLVSMDLEDKIGAVNNPLPSFNPTVSPLRDVPKNLEKTLSDCRLMLSRSKKAGTVHEETEKRS